MATVTKANIFKEIETIFANNTIIGDYEDREKRIEERNMSMPILKGLYSESSIIVYLERKGYKNGSKLHCAVHDYFTDYKRKFKTVQIPMPNWSTANQIRQKSYEHLSFYCLKDFDLGNIVHEYTETIFELAEKKIKFIIEGSKNVEPRKTKKK